MIHAREDYNRIQDPALSNPTLLASGTSPVGEDEPVFMVRAKDITAPAVMEAWANLAEMVGVDWRMIDIVRAHAQRTREWQREHGMKIPDLPRL